MMKWLEQPLSKIAVVLVRGSVVVELMKEQISGKSGDAV